MPGEAALRDWSGLTARRTLAQLQVEFARYNLSVFKEDLVNVPTRNSSTTPGCSLRSSSYCETSSP